VKLLKVDLEVQRHLGPHRHIALVEVPAPAVSGTVLVALAHRPVVAVVALIPDWF